MEVKVFVFDGLDISQGLIFLDNNAHDIKSIQSVENIVVKPKRVKYRMCIFGGLIMMFFSGIFFGAGIGLLLIGIFLWRLSRPLQAVLIKTQSGKEISFTSNNLEVLEQVSQALKTAHSWQMEHTN